MSTVSTRFPAPHTYEVATPPTFTPVVRPMRDDEFPWAIHSWSQAWKDAPRNRSRTWNDYKTSPTGVQIVRDALCRPDCARLAVDGIVPARAIGWLVFSRRQGYDAVHWVYVVKQFRRAGSRGLAPTGAMAALFDTAALQRSIVYTFEAACDPRLPRIKPPPGQRDSHPGRNDVWLAEHLRDRGHVVSHVPYAEWAK